MRTLRFGGEHIDNLLNGTKEITVRRYREEAHGFHAGESIKAIIEDENEFLSFIVVAAENTEVKRLNELTFEELDADGFETHADALECLKSYYPDLTMVSEVAVIRFTIPKLDGERIVFYQTK